MSEDFECPGVEFVAALAHAARGYCHLACVKPAGPHDDACVWFGTIEPVPTALPQLLPNPPLRKTPSEPRATVTPKSHYPGSIAGPQTATSRPHEATGECCTDARDADPWKTWVWHDHNSQP